ncbi:NAD(P)/FAD-dependent oxidoreductase [Enterocloster bolteae]|uniref:NAD(P)/FAD-dependent oxidoreductase n=1 Tax=Enterocloster bolteae TaxID=208479 RepID=UPI0021098B25|nr:NAD(P)/FAD-dependent oxidoreductase [Enterocloster bolteae]MCQ5146445.1 NAD(P)/FAD-dependent oxidoreductase [Enterocloster bolteae]
MIKADIVIIGAGAVGCAIARELSKYKVNIVVVDKRDDVGGDASKSNSAIIHTGYDAVPGTLESQLVVAANPMYDQLTKDLDIPFERIGAILPAFNEEQFEKLASIKEKAFRNHVYDVEYLSKQEILEKEPELNKNVLGGLFIPRESIIDPFIFVQALAENANENGVDFLLNTEVTDIKVENGAIKTVETTGGIIAASFVINAAALHCDDIAAMVGKADYKVVARRGQFYILDKNTSCKVKNIVLPIPTKVTKGKLMTPTIHGNMLVGPTAEDLGDKVDVSTTTEGLDSIYEDVSKMIPNVNIRDTITQYSGLRPNRNPEGLHVDIYDDLKGYINLSGVRSTGLTLSISMGKYVAEKLKETGCELVFKEEYKTTRKGIPCFHQMSVSEQEAIIKAEPAYGTIICRCETITEGEILNAINRPLGAKTVDAVKRRVRAGMGRCQSGFCGPKVIEILARELNVPVDKINKNLEGSYMIVGKNK